MKPLPLVLAASALLGLTNLAYPAFADETGDRVGVAGAVNPATESQPPGLPRRTLLIGKDIVFNERIKTGADGQTQVLFLDRSSLSVGPDAEIVVDEFVYDRAMGTGRLVVSASKGVFRFVGGAISKNADAVVFHTPTAAIGIRGGMFVAEVGEDKTTVAKLFGDTLTVTSARGREVIYRNGYQITAEADGRLSPIRPLPPGTGGFVGTAGRQLDGHPGAAGGAREVPTEPQMQRSGVMEANSIATQQSHEDAQRRNMAPGGGRPGPGMGPRPVLGLGPRPMPGAGSFPGPPEIRTAVAGGTLQMGPGAYTLPPP